MLPSGRCGVKEDMSAASAVFDANDSASVFGLNSAAETCCSRFTDGVTCPCSRSDRAVRVDYAADVARDLETLSDAELAHLLC
jgi:hypothetical protein